jgi:hypothetical protein
MARWRRYCRRTGFRPLLPGGVPGFDLPVGRTSTNTLQVAYRDKLGTSTTSVAVSGALVSTQVVLTTQAGVAGWVAGQRVTAKGAGASTVYFHGDIASYSGTSLTINVTNVGANGTRTDWDIYNLPFQMSYDSGVSGIRTGSTTADFTVADWDFRGINASFYIQNDHKVTFSQCLFDLSNYTVANAVFLGSRSGTPTIELSRCTLDGMYSTIGVTACIGTRVTLVEYCDIKAWPSDIFNLGPVASTDTIIRYNRVHGACSAAAATELHADTFQMTAWASGSSFQIYGNQLTMTLTQGGVDITGIINFGSISGAWSVDTTIRDNIMYAGGAFYPIAITENGSAFTAAVTFSGNYIAGIGTNAFYPTIKVPAGLVVPSLKSATDGAALTFDYKANDGSDINDASSIP